MWSDNETSDDLLGFNVHSELIADLSCDESLLPVIIGVFGDWGGGKSSVMKMIEGSLADRDGVVCIYFNGWMFEGYEDAKSAVLTSILIALGEHEKFGPKVRKQVGALLRRVQWMNVGRAAVKHVGVPLAAGMLTGGAATVPTFLASLIPSSMGGAPAPESAKTSAGSEKLGEGEEINWLDFMRTEADKPDLLEVRKFREDFERMLADTDIKSLVILIDDLDRCLPPRIIETLEAIKLFVAVPKTAFVIGADERIIRHAIATRYAKHQLDMQELEPQPAEGEERERPYDLTTDYLEKLIQVPYHLPRLSPAEIETYINLLLCQKHLASSSPESYATIRRSWEEKRRSDFYMALGHGAINSALQDGVPQELATQLAWSSGVARPLTEGLKGNPRQVKRMLNAMLLRTRLAQVAKLEIRSDILAKLMVLEYTRPELFRTLSDWQTVSDGVPPELQSLEQCVLNDEKITEYPKWDKPGVRNWLAIEPPLSGVDLRDYFWIARDRTKSTLAAASMVSPHINALYRQLVGGNEGEQEAAANAVVELDPVEIDTLLTLLEKHIIRRPDEDAASEALVLLIDRRVEGADSSLFSALREAPADSMSPSVPGRLQILANAHPDLLDTVRDLLQHLRGKESTTVGLAAQETLKFMAGR
jgi:hypothetical protein